MTVHTLTQEVVEVTPQFQKELDQLLHETIFAPVAEEEGESEEDLGELRTPTKPKLQ